MALKPLGEKIVNILINGTQEASYTQSAETGDYDVAVDASVPNSDYRFVSKSESAREPSTSNYEDTWLNPWVSDNPSSSEMFDSPTFRYTIGVEKISGNGSGETILYVDGTQVDSVYAGDAGVTDSSSGTVSSWNRIHVDRSGNGENLHTIDYDIDAGRVTSDSELNVSTSVTKL